MLINTTRFGQLEVADEDVIRFPAGLPGLKDCTSFVLLADAHHEALGWLQSTQHDEVALAVVTPGTFVPGYELRVGRAELGSELSARQDELHVLVIIGKNERGITLNLKAPLVIDLAARVGRQVVANSELPVQYELASIASPVRRAA
jgi:flagellar assembly factor FliW